jgi:uncharacterized protein
VNLKTRKHHLLSLAIFVAGLIHYVPGTAQVVENAVFWEVSGNGLTKPSYIFGTFHLMGKKYVDSLTNVSAKLHQSEAVVGELIIDSTMMMKIMMASQLKGTTLDKLLSADVYEKTSTWLKELSGYDLKLFNGMNPMTIQVTLMASMQQKYYPTDPKTDPAMDLYFQQFGKSNGKQVLGLESLDDQIQALFGQFTYERQTALLTEFVNDKDKAYREMVDMNKYYRQGNLVELEKMMSSQTFEANEALVLLDNRNKKWVTILPDIFKKQQTFVAVGALHLAGKNGLVNLLREKGYTLRSVKL